MWDYDHDKIPKSLNVWFNKKPKHSYGTRFVTQGKLTPCNYKTTKFGIIHFEMKEQNYLMNSKITKCI